MGRTRSAPGILCDRAHEWVSLRLDGELSQLEAALLASHLDRCAACREFAGEVAGVTHELRRAPLAPLARPVALPRRHVSAFRAARVSAAAAVMLVAAGLGAVFAPTIDRENPTVRGGIARLALANDERQLRELRRVQLRVEVAMLQTNPRNIIGHLT